jgi:acetone carboxylase gamma subunit
MKKTFMYLTALLSFVTLLSCNKTQTKPLQKSLLASSSLAAATISDYAIYTFQCLSGGKYIEVSGNPLYNEKFSDQRAITQYASSVSNGNIDGWQRWHIIYKTTVNNVKYYYIRNVFSGKLLDVPGGSHTSGTQLQQYAEFIFPSDEQLWSITATDSAYRIINKGSGMAVTNAGSSTTNGSAITQETAGTGNNQKWRLVERVADTYRDDNVVRFFNRNGTTQGSVAFDQGTSIPMSNGNVLWITQDAWDGASLQANGKFSCNSFFSYGNSILIQPTANNWNSDAPNMTRDSSAQNKPKQICDIQSGNSFAWPGHGVEIGSHVYIQCGEGSGLNATNQSLYDITLKSGNKWQVKRTLPAGMSGQAAINYAAGMVKAADGYVYVFGTQGTGFGYTLNVHVARFPVTNPQSWTFWNGSSWVSTPVTGDAARIGDGLGTSYIAYVNGKYVMVIMDQGFNCDNTRNIYTATASSPTGPFTARTQVYSISEYLYGNYARYYTPAIHPESINGRNELLITYCLNFSACGVEDCVDGYLDPYFYRVKAIRVPYSKIGL